MRWRYAPEKILSLGVCGARPSTVNLDVIHTYTLQCQSEAEAREMVRTCGGFGFGRTPEVLREVERARLQTEAADAEAAGVADECARIEAELQSLRRRRRDQRGMWAGAGRHEGDDETDGSRDGGSSAGTASDESESENGDFGGSVARMRHHSMHNGHGHVRMLLAAEAARSSLLCTDPEVALSVPAALLPPRPSHGVGQQASPPAPHRISPPPRSPRSPVGVRPPPPPPEALCASPTIAPAPPPFSFPADR